MKSYFEQIYPSCTCGESEQKHIHVTQFSVGGDVYNPVEIMGWLDIISEFPWNNVRILNLGWGIPGTGAVVGTTQIFTN